MHILANGAGRNLRSTIMNRLNITVMKGQILEKTGKTPVRTNAAALACPVCRNRLESPYACREQ